jgi:hypothetical protein
MGDMNSGQEKGQKRQYLLGVLGLGLIFTAVWAALLAFVPPSDVLTIIDYVMYFMSLFVIAFPTNAVLKLYITKSYYPAVIAAAVWALWTFGLRFLFMWLMGMLGV